MTDGGAPGRRTTRKTSRKRANIPTGTVTFLFTDIEGSTAMWEDYPDQMQEALARHDEILRGAVEARGGYVFKMIGDACCAAFGDAKQALEATLAAQRALFAEQWGRNISIRVRMGLHTGVPEERNGDYFGPPVNRVARLLSAGHGGQILLSAVTYGLVRDTLRHLEPGSELRDLGEHRLRDLRYTERLYQLVVPDLPSEFPPPRGEPVSAAEQQTPLLQQQTPASHDTPAVAEPSSPAAARPDRPQEEVRATSPEGPTLEKRYRRKRIIGSGGMAEVYLAHDEVLDRDVALKVLRREYAGDAQFVERFRREARNAAALSHPNIVQVYDRGGSAEEGSYYMVMEYVPGGNLKDRIAREGALPASVASSLALEIARALAAAHRRGVIHRDVKPQNVLLTEEGEAKVADFGIARAANSSTITKTGAVLGTAHYIAPEQALGQPASFQSDLYSLGVVLYEMLTGELPHDAETPLGVAMQRVSGQLRPPREVNPEVPEGIDAVTVRLMAKDPEDRYQDASEVVRDLEQVVREPQTTPGREAALAAGSEGMGQRAQQDATTSPATREAVLDRGAAGAARAPASSPSRGTRLLLLAGLVCVVLAGLGGGAIALTSLLDGEPEPRPVNPDPPPQRPDDPAPEVNAAELEEEVRAAAEDYYEAVDREDWAYTYDNLDSRTQQMFTEEEWFQKNQWFADNEGLELSSMDVDVDLSSSRTTANVTVDRTFKDGTSIARETYFVSEDGSWKHRFSQEETEIFMPGVPLEEFVAAQQGSSPASTASASAASSGEEAAIVSAIRGHYEAIGDQNFEEAYSYFGPTFRSTTEEAIWVEDEESYDIQSSTIYSVEVNEVSGYTAIATVDVGFEDNTGTPRFLVTWELVQEGGEWKLDEQLSAQRTG